MDRSAREQLAGTRSRRECTPTELCSHADGDGDGDGDGDAAMRQREQERESRVATQSRRAGQGRTPINVFSPPSLTA